MNTNRSLSEKNFQAFVAGLIEAGTGVIAPVRCAVPAGERIEYRRVQAPENICLSGALPSGPLKKVVFPRSEPLFRWRRERSAIEIEEVPTDFGETVVVGARPCDAAALDIVDRVMGWDYCDELWFGRRKALAILSTACSACDDACFCTSVGVSPAGSRGADMVMTPAGDGYLVQVVTRKGERLAGRFNGMFAETDAEAAPSELEDTLRPNLDVNPVSVRKWLEKHFDSPLWDEIALRCHGCGACAFVCPACHCFDIVDEPEGIDRGVRRRNWDACQTALFTLHGSGHNPRRDQGSRFRQRIMHKFQVYPARFGDVLCTGCGRCIRACAAGMDLISILGDIGRMAEKEGSL